MSYFVSLVICFTFLSSSDLLSFEIAIVSVCHFLIATLLSLLLLLLTFYSNPPFSSISQCGLSWLYEQLKVTLFCIISPSSLFFPWVRYFHGSAYLHSIDQFPPMAKNTPSGRYAPLSSLQVRYFSIFSTLDAWVPIKLCRVV